MPIFFKKKNWALFFGANLFFLAHLSPIPNLDLIIPAVVFSYSFTIMVYHPRTNQGHHNVKGATKWHKGAAAGVFGILGGKLGGIKTGTKLHAGNNFTQNVAIYEY